jgi:hypothetical protein
MSSKMVSNTHDQLMKSIGPIHEELSRLTMEVEKLHNERVILKAMAISELGNTAIPKEAIGSLVAGCW